ncbi:MAG TPA: choice-of-anchor tandem repeat GloVer-containing protein [Candidatus Eremiobacteraceae bacterium]
MTNSPGQLPKVGEKRGIGYVELGLQNYAEHERVRYSFQGGNDGSDPTGNLIADSSGALYGTTADGNALGYGIVFKLTPSGSGYVESILYAFGGGTDGQRPMAGLIADSTGALYGTTYVGGNGLPLCGTSIGCGTVFKLTPSGNSYTESILYRFQYNPPGPGVWDGAFPYSGVVADASGALFGTTYGGTQSTRRTARARDWRDTPKQ